MSSVRHHGLICRGDCLISDIDYGLNLVDETKKSIEIAGLRSKVKIIQTHSPTYTNEYDSFVLLPFELGVDICVFIRLEDNCDGMYSDILTLLAETIVSQEELFLEKQNIAMVCCLFADNSELLQQVLKIRRYRMDCLMSWLLERAIVNKYVECIETLLEFGASPLHFVSRRDEFHSPIRFCMHMLTVYSEEEPVLAAILKLLIRFGLVRDDTALFNKVDLMYIDVLPVYSREATITLVDACASISDNVFRQLVEVMEFSLNKRFLRRTSDYSSLVSVGIVALVRAGARFEYSPSTQILFDGLHQKRWSPSSRDIEIFAESRSQYSCLPGKFSQRFSIFRHGFPRGLQEIARQAVLFQLPFGVQRRNAAIEQLSLPTCLINYLKFTAFDYEV